MSRGTQIPKLILFVFNDIPGLSQSVIAIMTEAHKAISDP